MQAGHASTGVRLVYVHFDISYRFMTFLTVRDISPHFHLYHLVFGHFGMYLSFFLRKLSFLSNLISIIQVAGNIFGVILVVIILFISGNTVCIVVVFV